MRGVEHLIVQRTDADRRTVIHLEGVIDEGAAGSLQSAFADPARLIQVNFRGIKRINSYGIGLLMKHLGQVSRGHSVEFVECSATIVDQFQMLDFSMYGRIRSFFIRYYCEGCGAEEEKLLTVELDVQNTDREPTVPSYACPCGGQLSVDESLEFLVEHLDA